MDGRPFVVLAVNLAEPPSRIRGYLEKMPLGFTVLLDRGLCSCQGLEGAHPAGDVRRRTRR
jgi:hypothetical protein